MNRALKIFGVVLLVLLASVGAGYWWLSRPVEAAVFEEPGPSFESRARAGVVDTILAEYGVTDAYFVAKEEQAFAGYNAPSGGGTYDEATLQFAAMLALAQAAPEAKTGYAVLHVDNVAKLSWTGNLDALRAIGDDGAALEAWIASVEKAAL